MLLGRAFWLGLLAPLGLGLPAVATPYLVSLGNLPGGSAARAFAVSGNGLVVVGEDATPNGHEAFRWEAGVMVGLGDLDGGNIDSTARGVSYDGEVVVGWAGNEAYRWSGGVMTGLGTALPGAFSSGATNVSADGSVVVGAASFPALSSTAVTISGASFTDLGDLPGGSHESAANDVSADGAVVVGRAATASGYVAFRWENGVMTGLWPGQARAVSADGLVVVGEIGLGSGSGEAAVWKNGITVGLGYLCGTCNQTVAFAVSGDGSVVVGGGKTASGNDQAFIWDALNGLRPLADALLAAGVPDVARVEAALARTAALIDATGARGFQPLALEARSKLALTTGDRAQAQRLRNEAQQLFAAMGAAVHAERLRAKIEVARA